MKAPLIVLGAWLLFAGTHLLLGLPPLRGVLARRLGAQRFVAVFSAVAAASLGMLALSVAALGNQGPGGPSLGEIPVARIFLAVIALLGLVLAVAGLLNYMRSPMALFRTRLRAAAGIERITRHPFFMGLTMFAIAHALLATTLASSIHFAGFAVLAFVGALLQDRKLLARYGTDYAAYVAATSVLPFAALLRGRQRIDADDRLPRRIALSTGVALLLLATHSLWTAFNGAPLAALMAVGGLAASIRRWRFGAAAPGTSPQQRGGQHPSGG